MPWLYEEHGEYHVFRTSCDIFLHAVTLHVLPLHVLRSGISLCTAIMLDQSLYTVLRATVLCMIHMHNNTRTQLFSYSVRVVYTKYMDFHNSETTQKCAGFFKLAIRICARYNYIEKVVTISYSLNAGSGRTETREKTLVLWSRCTRTYVLVHCIYCIQYSRPAQKCGPVTRDYGRPCIRTVPPYKVTKDYVGERKRLGVWICLCRNRKYAKDRAWALRLLI